tara:strand:+ start:10093 stop:10401 length:309 start_codon:yes stop_codon:yes gene_type:complete
MYNDEKEITFLDIITKTNFFGDFIFWTPFACFALVIAWGMFKLISGNDPNLDLMSNEIGNFIIFLSVLISGYKNYNSCYDRLCRERNQRIKERREWEINRRK